MSWTKCIHRVFVYDDPSFVSHPPSHYLRSSKGNPKGALTNAAAQSLADAEGADIAVWEEHSYQSGTIAGTEWKRVFVAKGCPNDE